ncbi:PAPA-1-like family protein / zinc finger (HIT type) family protein [Raphanus sativus]|nr:PAPA-1-like family protein / zinc finger (HIT type) family protein [Raphanus sativus]
MEPAASEGGSPSTLAGFMDRRKRSPLIRRPRDVKESFHSVTCPPPSTQTNVSPSNESNPTLNTLKLKLKLGSGVTRTIQTKSEASTYTKATDKGQRCVQKTMCLGEIDRPRVNPSDAVVVRGASMSEKRKQGLKKRLLDPEEDRDDDDDDDDGDEEIRYLEKLKSKRARDHHHAVAERDNLRMGTVDSFAEGSTSGKVPTTRTRALQAGKDPFSTLGSGPLEFPDGLPCPSSKRQKQKLSEVEQQSKKAEAAQRRRIQSEKAAQEAEERATRSSTLPSDTIRVVIGPSGTTLTFSEDIGLPDIFKPITHSYPPPREKCVGPNCEEAYKYRDSKTNLPLCSLTCYKAIQEKMQQQQQPLIHC